MQINKILDRIQNLAISSSVYDQIGCKADDGEIYIPPTTHLVATIDDLTDVLDYGEATDMDEDADGTIENTLLLLNTGRWTTTSTYDVYMVGTPIPLQDVSVDREGPTMGNLVAIPQ